jgi:predicted lipase
MISDLECVRACAATYTQPPTLPVPASGATVRITTAADGATAIVAFRGSVTVQDWLRDFFFAPVRVRDHPQLGRCHAGFLDDAESIVDTVAAAVRARPFVLTGHSLGGALAVGVAGLLLCAGIAPDGVVTFGAPRFGMARFAALLKPCAVRQYVRGNDPVPTVPFDVPPEWEFLDSREPPICIGKAQADRFACHHIEGYVADVAAYLTPQLQQGAA